MNHLLNLSGRTGAVLFACILSFACPAPSLQAEVFPMPADTVFDPSPALNGSPTRAILTYAIDADGNTIPRKTLRITNNHTETVFPILRSPNSNVQPNNKQKGLYNPYDDPNKEYRAYIGYKDVDGKYYFGLRPNESILIQIPLVFWDAARIGIGTDGRFLTPSQPPNPIPYHPNAKRVITAAEPGEGTSGQGVIMWYRADVAEGPKDDTEDQLAEWTIRDHGYLSNPQITVRTGNQIPDNQLVTLINYDVSNVDNLYLPLSMQVLDSWVVPQSGGTGPNPNRDGWKPGSDPDTFGWTGAVDSMATLQARMREFTADNNKLLGRYFGGKGWPFYNFPETESGAPPVKIPSGANVFAQSPLRGTSSSYGTGTWLTDKFMLSSGGTEPKKVDIGSSSQPDRPGSRTLTLNKAGEPQIKMDFIKNGYRVEAGVAPGKTNPIQPDTFVNAVDHEKWTVTLSKPLVASSEGAVFTFNRPVSDYASEAMIRLWYSWAEYYRANWRNRNRMAPTFPIKVRGSIQNLTAALNFDQPQNGLVEGMSVTGPGLDTVMTEVGLHQGDAVILKIATDRKSVILSQVADATTQSQDYTISPPKELLWTLKSSKDPGFPLFGAKMKFGPQPAWRDPYEFSQAVYLVMASMNQIGQPNNDSVTKFMQDVIGANMGFIFRQAAKDADDGKLVTAMIRDMVKSVLRGVSDFTKYPDILDANGNHLAWYPDPSVPTGGQDFNVFNLDPFVWFVHVRLGFSGYGFSVDDDTADIGAGGANRLQISVGGTGGLSKLSEWKIQAPFGPIENVTADYSGPNNGDTLYNAIKNVGNGTPITVTTDGQNNLQENTIVVIDQVVGNSAANGTFLARNVKPNSFDLYDVKTEKPVASNGQYSPKPTPGRWSLPKRPYIDTGSDLRKVFWRVIGDDALGTFQGTRVKVLNVATRETVKIRVSQLGIQSSGRLILNSKIIRADGSDLPAGTYQFTFFGE